MPLDEINKILSQNKQTPLSVLVLPEDLTAEDFTTLITKAANFAAVEELRVPGYNPLHWPPLILTAFASRLPKLSRLHIGESYGLTDTSLREILSRIPTLTQIDLWNCPYVTDESLQIIAACLPTLTSLGLSYCTQVTDTGVKLIAEHFKALTKLNLSYCVQLTTLPIALRDLQDLKHLNVQNIPGLKLPAELTRGSTNPRAILDYYFRTAAEGRQVLNEAKLILVGNEAVGKTSLVNFLVRKKACKDTAKTSGVEIVEGVDVTSWDMDTADTGETPLKLNVWDFGGQQVLYETHQFFLTARSLYLIVLEARRENANEQEANLHAWIRSIRTRTVEPVPVIVVINKSEPPHDLRLDEARLIREFPNLRGFIRTSCRDPKKHKHGGRGIDELRKAIVDVIRSDLPHVRDHFPVSYFNIKQKLAKTARRSFILNTKEYRKKCAAHNVTDSREQDDLLTLLNCIGMVVKYDDTTLLDPNWLTTAVYRILTHEAVIESQGEFDRADLGRFLDGLSQKDYPRERWPFIVEMMKRFGLSFELPGQLGRYLLPNQLPGIDPQLKWDNADSLRFRYEYRHTPPRGLLPRFIVQAHQLLSVPRITWLSGAMFQIQGCPVLVWMDRQERLVHVSVRGAVHKRRDALSVVREHFSFVHALSRFRSGVEFTAQVPVDIPNKSSAAFDFEDLETYERNGVDIILYKGNDQKFSVKNLLAGVGPEPVVRDSSKQLAKEVIYIFNAPVGDIYDDSSVYRFHEENDMSEFNQDNRGANMQGAVFGDNARVRNEKILTIQKNLPPTGSPVEELKVVLKAALEELAKEQLDEEDRAEAKEAVEKIEREMAKTVPNKDRVTRWVEGVEKVSGVVGGLIRGAKAVAALFV